MKQISIPIRSGSDVGLKKFWTPYMSYLHSTDEAMYPAKAPIFLPLKTTLEFEDNKTVYTVGDEIRLNIHLKYQPHNPYGGDNLRATIHDNNHVASSSGYVIDHRNGSYTAVFKALWAGDCQILIQIKYTRFEIAYIYETRQQMTTVRTILGVYTNNKTREVVLCLPISTGFENPNSICSYTKENGQVPWYCAKPKTSVLKCEDLNFLAASPFDEEAIMKVLPKMSKFWRVENRNKTVNIQVKGSDMSAKKVLYCKDFNKRALWMMPSPVGYFYEGKWIINHCTSPLATKKRTLSECVKNKHFILYGDSTSLQWFEDLSKQLNCSSSKPTKHMLHEKIANNADLNLKIHFIRHNIPGNVYNSINVHNPEKMNFKSTPLHNLTDTVEHNSTPILIIHLYFHYSYYHQSIYRSRMELLKTSIQEILTKRPDSKILIKGPHLIQKKTIGTCDYFAYVYRTIMIEELREVLHKVIYIDYMDMSSATLIKDIHPEAATVTEMVNQMLAYIC